MNRMTSLTLGTMLAGALLVTGSAFAEDRMHGYGHGPDGYNCTPGYDCGYNQQGGPFGGNGPGGPGGWSNNRHYGPSFSGPFSHGPDRMTRKEFRQWRTDRTGKWMAYVKAELEITDKQEKAWKAFSDAVRERADTPRERFRSDETDRVTRDIAHLEHRIAQMQGYLKKARALQSARGALLKVLTNEQKDIAEELLVEGGR